MTPGPARARRRRAARWGAVLLASLLAAGAGAQSNPRVTLQRADATLTIVNEGRSAEGARSVLNLAQCGEEGRVPSYFYAPGAGVTLRMEPAEAEAPTVVRAPLMILTRPADDDGDGGEEGDAGETIEGLDAEATFGRPPCLEEVTRADPSEVRLEQGRTTVTGARFFLDEEADVATMDGPVALQRRAEGDAPALEADAESLRFDLGEDRTVLRGGVEVRTEERVSEADELELDEAAGLAVLRGDPAVSRSGDEVLRGRTLIYDLDGDDVVAEGDVDATFELDEDGAAGGASDGADADAGGNDGDGSPGADDGDDGSP